MKDFFHYRESLTEARKKPVKKKPVRKAKKPAPVKRNGEDYTDIDLQSRFNDKMPKFKGSMVTDMKVAEIKKITSSAVAKMSDQERGSLSARLDDDANLLDALYDLYDAEVDNQQDWLNDPDSDDKSSIRREIRGYEKMKGKIDKHLDLIDKVIKLLP